MIELRPCPICKNTSPKIGECVYQDKVRAYNVYCGECNFTGRSYKMRYKAVEKWNRMCIQVRGMVQ